MLPLSFHFLSHYPLPSPLASLLFSPSPAPPVPSPFPSPLTPLPASSPHLIQVIVVASGAVLDGPLPAQLPAAADEPAQAMVGGLHVLLGRSLQQLVQGRHCAGLEE